MTRRCRSPEEMEALGRRLAGYCPPGVCLHLRGELGAGKTTLVRGFLRGLGYAGIVKSPTYTLVEPYLIDNKTVYHFDLYRIGAPAELEGVGLRDYLDGESVCLVEWPERADGVLGSPDLLITITLDGPAREVTLTPATQPGRHLLARLDAVKAP